MKRPIFFTSFNIRMNKIFFLMSLMLSSLLLAETSVSPLSSKKQLPQEVAVEEDVLLFEEESEYEDLDEVEDFDIS